jgi:nucleoside-diphosphate-sugar epimerase
MFGIVKALPIVPMMGNGKTLKHFIYTDDLIRVIITAMEAKEVGTYLVADDRPLTISEFLNLLGDIQSEPRRLVRVPLPARIAMLSRFAPEKVSYPITWFYKNCAYDTTLARMRLGFSPKVGIEEGLQRVYDSLPKAATPK